MTNLERLEADIRAKLTRLMEPTKGCLFYFYGSVYTINHIDEFNVYASKSYREHTCIIREKFDIYACVYGHDPMLNDVLEWMWVKDNSRLLETHQSNLLIDSSNKWDLSHPYLKDQSQEIIDYLASLI
jgi:hypothetical protein